MDWNRNVFCASLGGDRPLSETEAPSYGAGLPNVVPDHLVKREKGTFRVFAESEIMDRFAFFISAIADPVLQSKETKIPLAEMVTEGGVMELRVKQTPAFLFFLRKLLYVTLPLWGDQ